MPLRRLLPLLSCPLCAVNNGSKPFPLLRNPFTLHCGHTVCSSHLPTLDPTQHCPLPICSSAANTNAAHPNIPSSSRVTYLPAPPLPPSSRQTTATHIDQFEQRVDITVSKLIELVSRHSPLPPPASDLDDSDQSDGDDGGDEHVIRLERPPIARTLRNLNEETEFRVARGMRRPFVHRRRPAPESTSQSTPPNHSESALPRTSPTSALSADSVQGALPSSPGRAGYSASLPSRISDGEISDSSDSSSEPPRKRLRCDSRALVTDQHSHAIEQTEAETGGSGGLNNPQPIPIHPEAEPHQVPGENVEDSRSNVDKELLTQLSCEICFAIYYQPVTTPCQHVSRPSPPDTNSESFCGIAPIIQPSVGSGCFHSLRIELSGAVSSHTFFERRSVEGVFKGP